MKLEYIIGEAAVAKSKECHSEEDYCRDDGSTVQLAISCRGHYTVAELQQKVRQLQEANRLYESHRAWVAGA